MKGRSGATLAELVVALVVLELGLLGTVGTLVLASSVTTRARDLDWAVHRARALVDSIAHDGYGGTGTEELGFGRLEWTGEAEGSRVQVRIQAWRRGRPGPALLDHFALVQARPAAE